MIIIVARLTSSTNAHAFLFRNVVRGTSIPRVFAGFLLQAGVHGSVERGQGRFWLESFTKRWCYRTGGRNNRVPRDKCGAFTFLPHLSVRLYVVVVVAHEMRSRTAQHRDVVDALVFPHDVLVLLFCCFPASPELAGRCVVVVHHVHPLAAVLCLCSMIIVVIISIMYW